MTNALIFVISHDRAQRALSTFMIKMNKTAILLALTAALFSASCSKSSSGDVAKPAAITYQYSFNDEFVVDSNGWMYTDPSNNTSVFVGSGNLNFLYHPTKAFVFDTVTVDPAMDVKNDFVIQTTVQSDNAMGFVFGVGTQNRGYAFEIDNNGHYGLFFQGDSLHARSFILNWTATSAAKPGDTNQLEIDQTNGEWYGYVNGTLIFSVTARPLLGTRVGYVVEPNTNGFSDYFHSKWN